MPMDFGAHVLITGPAAESAFTTPPARPRAPAMPERAVAVKTNAVTRSKKAAYRKKNPALAALLKTKTHYQTWQALARTMGCPALHPQAFWNSGMFCTTPVVRKFPGECSLLVASRRAIWS